MIIKRLAGLYPHARMRVKVDCDGLGVGVYDNLYEQKDRIIDEVWRAQCLKEGVNPESVGQCQDIPRLDLEIVECHFGGAGGKVDEEDPVECKMNI